MRITKTMVQIMAAEEIEYHLGRITELEEINEDFEEQMRKDFGRESTARELKWFREELERAYYLALNRLTKLREKL